MSERFYFPELAENASIEIDGSEAHHMLNVMKIKAGSVIELFDGKGHSAIGKVERAGKKSVVVAVGNVIRHSHELGTSLIMGIALPKGDRCRFLVEKCTELGVSCLAPLLTSRTTVKAGTGTQEKLCRYVIEASKQCGRNTLMRIHPETRLEEFIEQQRQSESRIVLHPESSHGLCAGDLQAVSSIAVCIGPEGGWTEAEMEMFIEEGWHCRTMGSRILRIETAAIAFASLISTLANE